MSKLITLIFSFWLTFASIASAETVSVECSAEVDNKVQKAIFKLNDGKIVLIDGKRYAKGDIKDSLFFWFVQDVNKSGLETHNTFMGKNGYAMVSINTTADNISIGINLKEQKGFYNYRDTGSGNGNSRVELACTKK